MNLIELITGNAGNQVASQAENKFGISKNQIIALLAVAAPLVISYLRKKSQEDPNEAEALNNALDKDHDGSKLNDITSMISNYKGENGSAILNHMFGDKKENIINSVSKSSGLDMNSTSNLMSMLAPFVLEFLGKNKKEQNLDADGISNLTSMASNFLGGSNGDLMGMLTNFLDADKDGSIVDDAMDLLGGLFKKK